jgi:hypothetical protein
VPDASDFDGVLVFRIEKNPLVAAAESKAVEWRLEFFHFSAALG